MLEAAAAAARTADHVLLSGPPGLGKTTLAMIIAAEMGDAAADHQRPGHPARRRPRRDPVLPDRGRGAVPRRDPPDGPARPRRCSTWRWRTSGSTSSSARGPGATAIPLELPPFTLVGATTRAGLLPGPLRDRFGFTAHMDFYAAAELERVLAPLGRLLDVTPDAGRRRRDRRPLPRHAPHRQPAAAPGPRLRPGQGRRGASTRGRRRGPRWRSTRSTTLGLDRLDRAVLDALCRRFGGGPVGLSTLAVAVGEERETVEEVAEPFLVREGLLARTPRGRVGDAGRLGAPGLRAAGRGAGGSRPSAWTRPDGAWDGPATGPRIRPDWSGGDRGRVGSRDPSRRRQRRRRKPPRRASCSSCSLIGGRSTS